MNYLTEKKEKATVLHGLEGSVETLTGKTACELRESTIAGYRTELEGSTKRPLKFKSSFPFIGRGNVLRDRIVDRAAIEKRLDSALR